MKKFHFFPGSGKSHSLITRIGFSICLLFLLLSGRAWGSRQIEVEPIATGLARPVDITNAGDGSGRLFIALQTAQIVIYDGTDVLPEPFLDISSLVSCCGERGLLGITFHPNYESNGFFYLNYTDTAGDTAIARYSVSVNPNVADPDSAFILLTIAQPFSNHNGGQLQFGPDGYLYIGIGDGGSGGDPQNNGQNLGTFLGKMLRIDVDGGVPYAIPPDNPFIDDPVALNEIWALGLRNPWRFSFDNSTGDLFIADVGQNSSEEVDFQSVDSQGGENYGWRLMEGSQCFNPPTDCDNGTLTLPILEYDHSLGCSITGGYRYRGTQNPRLSGMYLYGDWCSGRIWGANEDGDADWIAIELLDTDFRISTFGEDEAGEIYLADYDSSNGVIYRIFQSDAVIARIRPGVTEPRGKVRILGRNFGDTIGDSIVHVGKRTFDASSSRIKSWSDTKIKIKVPNYDCDWFKGEDLKKQKVWVTVDGIDSNNKRLKVMKPVTCP